MSNSVTLAAARAVIEAACKKAEKIGVPMNVAVVDSGANLVAFVRMDGAWLGSIDIDLALLHLGGTMFFNLMMVTMDPKQGVEVIKIVKPKTAIPIHYDDYTAFESALGDTGHPPEDERPDGTC